MRNMISGKIKCRSYWNNIQGLEERALCASCKKKESREIIEGEQHLWLECSNNGRNVARETAKRFWEKSTQRPWPNISLSLIRGAAAITFENAHNKDAERLRILISLTIWAIWKSRYNNTINNQDVELSEATRTLKELIRDLMRKRWNTMRFLEDTVAAWRMSGQRALKTLWADGHLTKFDPKTGPDIDSL